MLEVLLGVMLLGLGGAAGWLAHGLYALAKQVKSEPDVPEACEAERLREDRRAFETLMGYNVDMAYGLDREEE